MPVETIVSLLTALSAFAPQLPQLVSAVKTAVRLLESGAAPTAEEQKVIDDGLDAANEALQAS